MAAMEEDDQENLDPAWYGLGQIDPEFEFSAPQYYDFTIPETSQQIRQAECWFVTAVTYADSPFSTASRGSLLNTGCSSHELQEEMDQLVSRSSPQQQANVQSYGRDEYGHAHQSSTSMDSPTNHQDRATVYFGGELDEVDLRTPQQCKNQAMQMADRYPASANCAVPLSPGSLPAKRLFSDVSNKVSQGGNAIGARSSKTLPSRGIKKNTVLKKDQCNGQKPNPQDDHVKKKQKLEGGRLKKIMGAKEPPPPKTPATITVPQAFRFHTDKRFAAHKASECSSTSKITNVASSPFVSMAEKVRRFQMKTPERFHQRPLTNEGPIPNPFEKTRLKLTIPKTPGLETSQRVRPISVKSTAELEEEMLSKMPKFKARPLNKKIFEAPTMPTIQKSTPQPPEFHEFHLRTMERAQQHFSSASQKPGLSTADRQIVHSELRQCHTLAEPREPHLETAARARPPKVKSTEEREQEALANMPKFKALPLNKKIFLSRGDIGVFRSEKRQATMPKEFNFATDERLHQQMQQLPVDLFSKLSLNSNMESQLPRLTKPEPFHLVTEERGQEKEKRFQIDLVENAIKQQELRIPKANPLPLTTDYPEIPKKPEPKECTKPEPFHLESLVRHEEEMHRMEQDCRRMEQEEAEKRRFKAQPIISDGPVFVPETCRKPLTEVQEFSFHVDVRAVERSEFDQKVAEKQTLYKRFREEYEQAKKAEEERAIKALRRTMVPYARPAPSFHNPFVPQRWSPHPQMPYSSSAKTSLTKN